MDPISFKGTHQSKADVSSSLQKAHEAVRFGKHTPGNATVNYDTFSKARAEHMPLTWAGTGQSRM